MPIYSPQTGNPFEDATEVSSVEQQDFVLLNDGSDDLQKSAIANLPFASTAHGHEIDEITGLEIALSDKATINHGHPIADIDGLVSVLDGKASAIHSHSISDVTNLQTTLDDKVSSTTLANTVSVLQQTDTSLQNQINSNSTAIANKANKTVTDDLNTAVTALQQNDTNLQNQITANTNNLINKSDKGHTHQISDVSGLLEKLSFQWTRKNSNGELIYKTLVDTQNGDVILSIPSGVSANQEFEIKKIFSSNYCKVTGISKINGYTLQTGDILFFDDSLTQASTTKLIYIDNTVGWLSFPSTAFNTVKPLSLPTDKLKQLFYSGNISGLTDGQSIQTWIDPISGLNASQSSAANRPIYKANIFGNNTIPSVLFQGSQIFNVDYSWILNQRFTICIVERREVSTTDIPLIGNSTSPAGTFVAFYTDPNAISFSFSILNVRQLKNTTGAYTTPTTRMWCLSSNSREQSLWLNGTKVTVGTSALATAYASGLIGGNSSNRFAGHIPLLAFYLGDMTDTEIKAVLDAANQTFKVY